MFFHVLSGIPEVFFSRFLKVPNSTFILAVNTEVSQGLKWDLQELVQHGEMTHLEMSHKVICTVSSSRFVSFVDRLWSADKCCCCWARGTALSRFTPPYFPIYSTVQKFQNMCKHTWRFYNLKAWKSIFDLYSSSHPELYQESFLVMSVISLYE